MRSVLEPVRAFGAAGYGLLLVLAGWSLVPLAAAALHLVDQGGVYSGVDGLGVIDHFQYLAWVREAGEHALISNRFDLEGEAVYLQPMWLLSGLAWKAGAGVQIAFLLWKPVCVLVLFAGVAAYVGRTVDGPRARLVALALALFYFPPAAALLGWAGLASATGQGATELFAYEMSPPMYVWGYFQTAIAVGLMPVFLLTVEPLLDPVRRRAGRSARWYAVAAALTGLTVSWVHPWQGLVLLGIVAGVVVWGRPRQPHLALAAPAVATIAPLLYFAVLSRTDSAWEMGAREGSLPHAWGWLALSVGPLALAAAAGALARRPLRSLDLQDRMLLLWPLATLVAYGALDRSFYYHLVNGLTVPLAVLAVRSLPTRPRVRPALVVAAVALATVPGLLYALDSFREDHQRGSVARYLRGGEAEALAYLDGAGREGPVLARVYLGGAVPGFSGRRTYVGHPSWTRDFAIRAERAERLFGGRLAPAAAREIVRSTGARFVLADCSAPIDLRPVLGALVRTVRRFGCARVYEIRTPS